MAIAQDDGSIILKTKVDESGIKQGTSNIKSQVAKIAAEYKKSGMNASEAFKKAWNEVDKTKETTDNVTKATKKYGQQTQQSSNTAKSALSSVTPVLKRLAVAAATAFSVRKIIDFSKEASNLATTAEASVQRLIDIYGSASKVVGDFIDANAHALGMSRASASSYASIYGNLFSVWADQATNAQLTTQYLNMTAVVASKTGRTVEDVQERIRSGLLGNTEAIEDLGIFVNVKTIEMTDAFHRMADGKSWEQLDAYTQQQIRSMAILEQSTSKYGSEVANTTALTRSRFNAAYEDFKATWGKVVNQVLVPVLEILTDILVTATEVLSFLFDINENTINENNAIEQATESQNKLTDAVKETEKATKKALAGFDEINALEKSSANEYGVSIDGSSMDVNGVNNLVNSTETAKETTSELISMWNEFFYKTLGETSVSSILNLDNAFLRLKGSFEQLVQEVAKTFPGGEFDFSKVVADIISFNNDTTSGLLTTLSGGMDMLSGFYSGDFDTFWKGLGEALGGFVMTNIPFFETFGLSDSWRDFFYPVSEEVTNLYSDISAAQAEALEIYLDQFTDIKDEIKKTTYGVKITPKEINSAKTSLDKLTNTILSYAEKSKEEAYVSLSELVDKGFMTEDELAKAIEKLDVAYKEQEEIVTNSQEQIIKILENAASEERALTSSERETINNMLSKANAEMISTIKAGAGDREKIEKQLVDMQEQLSATHLSQVIQFANSEYEEKVKAAELTYKETVAQADKAYYELGIISEEQYKEIVANAEKQKKGEIQQAKDARTELVSIAQKKAGDIADTVDPDTGVIYSKWEVLWNRMSSYAKSIINKVIGFLNKIIDGFESVGGFLQVLGGDYVKLPRIPKLASGAVIPGGKEFLAVLGDQPRGQTNIEAPLDTIKQAVAEVLMARNMMMPQQDNRPIILSIDGREIARAVRTGNEMLGEQTVFGGFANAY